jgi:hypothetical protein
MLEKEEKRKRILPTYCGSFCCVVWLNLSSISPCFWVKTSKQKLAGNAAEHNKVKKNFCFLRRNFSHKISK